MRVVTIILGVLMVVGGIYCVLSPIATYSTLGWLIGVSMVVEGIASILTWSRLRDAGLANGWTMAGAIVSIALGVFLLGSFAMQFAVDLLFAYLIAIWLAVAGIARIVAAIGLRKHLGQEGARGWVVQLVLGVLIVIMGILCIINPLSIMASVGLMWGISIIVVGVQLIVASF